MGPHAHGDAAGHVVDALKAEGSARGRETTGDALSPMLPQCRGGGGGFIRAPPPPPRHPRTVEAWGWWRVAGSPGGGGDGSIDWDHQSL